MGVEKRCKHGKEKYYCYDCGGKGACACHKRKARCKIHGGHLLCKPHGIELYYCKRCKGGGICNHGFQKRHCRICAAQGRPVLCCHRLVTGLCLTCILENRDRLEKDDKQKKKSHAYAPATKKQKRQAIRLSIPSDLINVSV